MQPVLRSALSGQIPDVAGATATHPLATATSWQHALPQSGLASKPWEAVLWFWWSKNVFLSVTCLRLLCSQGLCHKIASFLPQIYQQTFSQNQPLKWGWLRQQKFLVLRRPPHVKKNSQKIPSNNFSIGPARVWKHLWFTKASAEYQQGKQVNPDSVQGSSGRQFIAIPTSSVF